MGQFRSISSTLWSSPVRAKPSVSTLPSPQLSAGGERPLFLESALAELPLHSFSAELDCLGTALAEQFEQHPLVPGVVLLSQGEFVGMLSRQRMLAFLLRPQGLKLFLEQPLRVLHSYARVSDLCLPGETPIVLATQQALRRAPELLGEPIVVKSEGQYFLLDFNQLNMAYWQIRGIETQVWYERTQVQMLQTTKMASLGRLVDGVSHEILDPVSFIWGNLSHLTEYNRYLLSLLQMYEEQMPNPPLAIANYREEIEIEYLREDIPHTLESIKTGADRLSKLATSLQNFCHIDEIYPKPTNIHAALDGVLLLLKSRLKSEIEVIKDYGHLPPVPCYVGQITQVFMNILSQMLHVLLTPIGANDLESELTLGLEAPARTAKPRIVVSTEACSIDGSGKRWVAIRIGHNGATVPPEVRQQIAEGFANTTRTSKETTLAMTYRMVTHKHKGKFKLTCVDEGEARLDKGLTTQFEILIPLT
jgi:signal transduction histidine kinase